LNPDQVKQLMARAQEAQAKLADLQRQLAARRVTGEAGGGMVRVEANGALRILSLSIEPSLLDSGDRAMIEDLCAAAVNAALGAAQRMVQEEMQQASAQLAGPNLADLFGAGGQG
jgi:DNA-binding YbaB/EbfC family protein